MYTAPPPDGRNGSRRHRTVADIVVATLRASGVRRVYGLPGDSLNAFTDALRRDGELAWEHVRHEESAALAAGGEATMTDQLAVCAASCGPGSVHLINGLFDANRSGVPVLAIAAQIPQMEIGSDYFQETRLAELFRDCSVFSEQVSVAEQLPRVLEMAMRHAVERRGVGVVVVPGELLGLGVPGGVLPRTIRRAGALVRPDEASILAAADMLNTGERVTILAGAGCRDAHDGLVELAERLEAPIVHSLRGKEWVEYDNPHDVGMTGLLGFPSGYRAMEHCDVLLMLGTDFPYRQFLPEHARIIQVDVRGERIGRRVPADVALVGTVKDTIAALLPRLSGGRDAAHRVRMIRHYRDARARFDAQAGAGRRAHSAIHPQMLTAAIDRVAAYDAVFLADVGTPTLWAARHLTMNGRRRLLGSFNHGTMANALPQALGVQASHPGRQVVTLSGDGGLSMLLGELLTLRQRRLPVKVVVFNNGALGFVELEMKAAGLVTYGTDLENPSFAEIGRAVGLHAVRIERPAELETGLRTAFDAPGPAVIEVATARQELSLPPRISVAQAKGFSLWATRSILSGRGDEVVEVARTNVSQLTDELRHGLDGRRGRTS
jgi:pyruvate dehydrogenase (quinone)